VPREEWDALVSEIEQRENMLVEGQGVKNLGGLHVMGTERHEARRIDLQLRGRCGRQGDPGSSRFFLSLEDDLMRIFAGEWVKRILDRLGMKEGERIESRMVTRRIEAAQKKVEERHFETRKSLLEYDEVMDEQRKQVYRYRQQILDGTNCRDLILEMIDRQVNHHIDTFFERDYGAASYASWVGTRLSATFDARTFRGMEPAEAEIFAKSEAERAAEAEISGAMEENLPDGEEDDPADWNWEALAKFANTRWGLNLRDRDLKTVGRDELLPFLHEKAQAAIDRVDLSEGAPMLAEGYGLKSALAWLRNKFGIDLSSEETAVEPAALKEHVCGLARQAYDQKESEYPVMAGMYRFSSRAREGQSRIDREQLIAWARDRFDVQLDLDDLKNKQRDEIRALLLDHSKAHNEQAGAAADAVRQKLAALSEASSNGRAASGQSSDGFSSSSGNGALDSLAEWSRKTLKCELSAKELADLEPDQLQRKLLAAVEDRYHPEMRRMERAVLLQIVDTAWKDHLLAMDYLLAAVRLKGWGQLDPKVEYKREGMQLFKQMWNSAGERVTDLIFRMEQLDEDFVGSTWVETSARHDEAQAASDIAAQQQAAIDASRGDEKIEPIRNRGQRVGRNDACPCGSGKKYKQCCMRKERIA